MAMPGRARPATKVWIVGGRDARARLVQDGCADADTDTENHGDEPIFSTLLTLSAGLVLSERSVPLVPGVQQVVKLSDECGPIDTEARQ